MKSRLLLSAVLTVLSLAGSLAHGQAPGTTRPSVIMAPVSPVQLHPGAPAKVELDFRVGSGFHINSNKPHSELLIPTVLKLDVPQPVAVELQYPAGEDQTFPFSPQEKLNVYSGDFAIDAVLKAPAKMAAGTYTVTGELRYQACDRNACYPPRSEPVKFQIVVK